MTITYYIGIGVLLAWALLGYVGHRYFVWREWDEDRRIDRAREVAQWNARLDYGPELRSYLRADSAKVYELHPFSVRV